MTHLTRMALPVPATGTALGDAGDAYIASLSIEILIDGRVVTTVDGATFEAIMSAVRLRHLAFHPRTRVLLSGSMKAAGFVKAVDRHWASIDSYAGEMPTITEIADTLLTAARSADFVGWNQAN